MPFHGECNSPTTVGSISPLSATVFVHYTYTCVIKPQILSYLNSYLLFEKFKNKKDILCLRTYSPFSAFFFHFYISEFPSNITFLLACKTPFLFLLVRFVNNKFSQLMYFFWCAWYLRRSQESFLPCSPLRVIFLCPFWRFSFQSSLSEIWL